MPLHEHTRWLEELQRLVPVDRRLRAPYCTGGYRDATRMVVEEKRELGTTNGAQLSFSSARSTIPSTSF